MTKLILAILASSTVFLGCGPRASTPADKPQTFDAHRELVATSGTDYFSYQFVDGNCTTGRHTFENHEELCRALADEGLNNFCAWQQRRDYYQQQCN